MPKITRFRILALAAIGLVLLAGLLPESSQANFQGASDGAVPPGTLQTNPTIAAFPPQPGFDPFTASAAELRAHGYPPRPPVGPARDA